MRRRVIADDFYRQLFYTMRRSASAIHWGNKDRTFNNGSLFFIRTPCGFFAVTALHVYHGYLEAATQKGATYCQIDNIRFDPVQRLVSKEGNIDVAVFRISESELHGLDKLTTPFPPVVPSVGQSAIFCGFPGIARDNPTPFNVAFSIYIGEFAVSNVSEISLSAIKPPNEELVDIVGKGFPDSGFDTGGMSGGPIIVPQETPAGIVVWSLAGIINEGHHSFDILRGIRADVINDDGTLKEQCAVFY